MKKNIFLYFSFALILGLVFTSCEKDDDEQPVLPAQEGKAQSETSLKSMQAFINFNEAAAVSYAKSYESRYNSTFPIYGNDCANFVSQCIYKGVGNQYDSPTWKPGVTSWYNANALFHYVTNKYRCEKITIRKYEKTKYKQMVDTFRPGDLIFWNWDGNSTYNHAMIIIGKETIVHQGVYINDPIIAGHNPLTNHLTDVPKAHLYWWMFDAASQVSSSGHFTLVRIGY